MYAHSYCKLFHVLTFHFHLRQHLLIHLYHCLHVTLHHSFSSQRTLNQHSQYLANTFSKSTNTRYNSLSFSRYFSCNCLRMKIASIVPLPATNPYCSSLISTIFLKHTFHHLHPMLQHLNFGRVLLWPHALACANHSYWLWA